MNRYEQAVAYHHKGFNCCQSVLAAYSDLTGLSQQASFDMGGGFGAGAQTGELCGPSPAPFSPLACSPRWTPRTLWAASAAPAPWPRNSRSASRRSSGPAMQAPAEGRDPGHRRHPRGPGYGPHQPLRRAHHHRHGDRGGDARGECLNPGRDCRVFCPSACSLGIQPVRRRLPIDGLVARPRPWGRPPWPSPTTGSCTGRWIFTGQPSRRASSPSSAARSMWPPGPASTGSMRWTTAPITWSSCAGTSRGTGTSPPWSAGASRRVFYGKPRVDWELLTRYHEGIIALSACLAGQLPRLLLAGDYAGAKAHALAMRDLFGPDNYYLELQDHGIPQQKQVLQGLVALHQETGIPLVATNDAHYLTRQTPPSRTSSCASRWARRWRTPTGCGLKPRSFT